MLVSRVALVFVVASCALLGAAAPSIASSQSTGLNVLVVGNCPGQTGPLATAIGEQSGIASATAFDSSAATPTPAQLVAEDLIVDTGDSCNVYADPVAYGNRLANYLDHGGVLLQTAYDVWSSSGTYPTGRFASGSYSPLTLGPNDNSGTTLGTVAKPNSPFVQGLGTFPNSDNTTNSLAPGATLLASWADARVAIAVKGRVVATSAGAYDGDTLPDLARLARNTAAYFNAVPSTKITDSRIDSAKGTAAFRFKAVGVSLGFVCELKKTGKKAAYTICPSHVKYSRLAPGKYLFAVVAVGPGGPDPTPATRRFRITS